MATLSKQGNDRTFGRTFEELTTEGEESHPPFRWQLRLLNCLIDGDLPSAVNVPTGLGKTSVMALWLIALAEGSKLPRRLVYVVDRRAVVDQATRFAERLRENLPSQLADKLGFGRDTRLPISTLRGGFADNRDWLEDPSRPAIIVGTVDMVGSRLLFEGYGVSRRMRPYHAGLLGVDSLVVLDEAHLCPPFESLLRQVEDLRDGHLGSRHSARPPPFRLLSLSATVRQDQWGGTPRPVFGLEDGDREDRVVRQRLRARKRLGVTKLTDPKTLTDRLAERAVELGFGVSPARVLVYCDRRSDAVEVKRLIDRECKQRTKATPNVAKPASELLVGARRVYERTSLEHWLEEHGLLGGSRRSPEAPVFLVSTSAGEVGVDLDADHVVCDLVALERMVQRLGRVNRRGGQGREAMIDVFAVYPVAKATSDKAKQDAERSVRLFERRLAALAKLPKGEDGRHDASPSAALELRRQHPAVVAAATTPAPLYPALSRPLLDAWAMTSLEQHEGRPEVGPWLRGWDAEDEPQTTVVWRTHLPYRQVGNTTAVVPDMVAAFFRMAPIHATEKLESESTRVFDWLLKRIASLGKDESLSVGHEDVVAIVIGRDGELVDSANMRELQRLAAPKSRLGAPESRARDQRKIDWQRFLPGCALIVDERIGGCRDGMLDEKSDLDVATADADEKWQSELEDVSASRARPSIRFRVDVVSAGEEDEELGLPEEVADWRHLRTFVTHVDEGGTARRGLAVYKWHDDAQDEEALSILARPQLLADHAREVADRVRHLAGRLNLPEEEVEALTIAARLHDDGKAAALWQQAMNAPADGVYAKTRGGGNLALLEGYRHEFGSLVRAARELLPDRMRDLVLHLIAAHHGYARPLISHRGCEDGAPSLLESFAGDAAVRFAVLQREYGPWGLAWREAILRAADQAVSREWSTRRQER